MAGILDELGKAVDKLQDLGGKAVDGAKDLFERQNPRWRIPLTRWPTGPRT